MVNKELMKTEGVKEDGGKVRFSLIAPEFLWELARLLTIGAQKYAARNWEQGMDWDRPLDALERHLTRWKGGETRDPETGVHHLICVACNCMFLFIFQLRGLGKDSRVIVYEDPEPTGERQDEPISLYREVA